ncbi:MULTISPECIES: hypothetical protein [unclassified Lysinibacillus]|uniref:hypothetical protein n=1 Tax=unclassified Lysinibacillus TaxID=2636778 RepID=UPI002010EF89|nr:MULTISPECIES: hypothetical protein [unclassified Lysinibacillus]MCL1696639.1 hypothetical protein [Lysinibacillus sp. BPa_S21]MCL1698878.1 hypothetical protein [Lysinibacillus sp. Bpr_S20]
MKKIMLPILLLFFAVSFRPIFVHANGNQKEDLLKIVSRFMPTDASLISPENPSSTLPIQLYDFDHDGQKEMIFTFEVKAENQPSQFGFIVLKKHNSDWRNIWETTVQGVNLDFSGLVDITGDGTKEYLFGVTIGAAAGSKLEIYQWIDNSFKKIADIPYHKMDFVNGKQKVGLAVWEMYIGESYLVDVLKWNGTKLVYDEELYHKYYPIIEKFYQEKISEMDAWFYWYCLADAQIKANKFEEASKSIQKGMALAKKSSMKEVIQDFNDLTEKLKNKRKHRQ